MWNEFMKLSQHWNYPCRTNIISYTWYILKCRNNFFFVLHIWGPSFHQICKLILTYLGWSHEILSVCISHMNIPPTKRKIQKCLSCPPIVHLYIYTTYCPFTIVQYHKSNMSCCPIETCFLFRILNVLPSKFRTKFIFYVSKCHPFTIRLYKTVCQFYWNIFYAFH